MDTTPAAAKPYEPRTINSQSLESEPTPREASADGDARATTSILIRRKGTSTHIDRRPLDISAMSKANTSFVRQELGDLDDLEVARIVALGATEGEICEAAAWLYADTDVVRDLPGPSTAKVQQILDIARAADDEDEPDPERG